LRGAIAFTEPDGQAGTVAAEILFTYKVAREVEGTAEDRELLSRAAGIRLAEEANRALKLEREGKREQAAKVLESAVMAAPMVSVEDRVEYQTLSRQMGRGLSEEDRKRRHYEEYRRRTSRTEAAHGPVAVEYEATRLTFKAKQIEPLEMGQSFRVITPMGVFQMTKQDFYETFPNVVESSSYQDNGNYNYSVLPKKAEPFRVHDSS
jgi:hypothetical protein